MVVWVSDGMNGSEDQRVPRPENDVTNVVTVSNVLVAGTSKTFSYQVIVFDPTPPPTDVPPALAWTVGASSLSAPAESGDTLYVQSTTGLMALETATGKFRWALSRGGIENTPVVGNGVVYIGEPGPRGGLLAVDSLTGDLRWFFFTGADARSSAALGSHDLIYFGTSHQLIEGKLETSGKLYAADALTGGRKWEFQSGGDILSSPAVGGAGLVYFTTALDWKGGVSTMDGGVYALRAETGELAWKFSAGAEIENSPALDSADGIYFGTSQGRFFCLDATTGEKRWDFYTRGACGFSSPVIDSDGSVYFGTTSGYLYALNEDGTKKWSRNIGAKLSSTPLVAGGDLLIFAATDGYLRAVNRADGTPRWTYNSDGKISLSSPVLTDTGILAFGTENMAPTVPESGPAIGKLFGLKGILPDAGVAPWPTFGQNARRSGSLKVSSTEPPRIGAVILDGANLSIPVLRGGEGAPLSLEVSADLRTWKKLDLGDPSSNGSLFKIELDKEQKNQFFRITQDGD
jgi:outer membrane protein assembly factor BamB